MNILIIYNESDLRSEYEHLLSFGQESKHKIFYSLSYSVKNIDFDLFDGIVFHHSVKYYSDSDANYISKKLKLFDGIKCLFMQDIHKNTNLLFKMIERIRFNIIFTSIPKESVGKIFPTRILEKIKFISALRGYFNENYLNHIKIKSIQEREFYIGYKGKSLPLNYGKLGQDKIEIADMGISFCTFNNMNFNITKSATERIYGDEYYNFLNNSKATLGSESGCNILDLKGMIHTKIGEMKKNKISNKFILDLLDEGGLTNHISPRMFESIFFRNYLILFEGNYSGVLKPYKHYFPLRKDGSNLAELKKILKDNKFIKKVTDRTFNDIIESKIYSYKSFIKIFDKTLDENVNKKVVNNADLEILLYLQSAYVSYFPVKPNFSKSSYGLGSEWPRNNESIDKSSYIPIPKVIKTLVLYDPTSTHVATTREHLESFEKYSKGTVYYLPSSTNFYKQNNCNEKIFDFSIFDVVIIHYTVRISLHHVLSNSFKEKIKTFKGKTVLFIQDEYEGTENARKVMEYVGFDIIYTCVPKKFIQKVYPHDRFPKTKFLNTLTGYVPENNKIEAFSIPMEERSLMIGYRGRVLSPIYGNLGKEKFNIGIDLKPILENKGIMHDIEVDDLFRVYGNDWYKFLGKFRATLGTESGSNIFDFDGKIIKKLNELTKNNPSIKYEELHKKVLAKHDGKIIMNQISPKIFEAIRLRTGLILFEGNYSNIIEPNIHFIPLKKDYSNIDDVLKKIRDLTYLKKMVDRAYEDIILSNKFSYESFVSNVYKDLNLTPSDHKGYLCSNNLLPTASNVAFKNSYFSYIDTSGKIIKAFPVLPLLETLSFNQFYSFSQQIQTLKAEKFTTELYQRRNQLFSCIDQIGQKTTELNLLSEKINILKTSNIKFVENKILKLPISILLRINHFFNQMKYKLYFIRSGLLKLYSPIPSALNRFYLIIKIKIKIFILDKFREFKYFFKLSLEIILYPTFFLKELIIFILKKILSVFKSFWNSVKYFLFFQRSKIFYLGTIYSKFKHSIKFKIKHYVNQIRNIVNSKIFYLGTVVNQIRNIGNSKIFYLGTVVNKIRNIGNSKIFYLGTVYPKFKYCVSQAFSRAPSVNIPASISLKVLMFILFKLSAFYFKIKDFVKR